MRTVTIVEFGEILQHAETLGYNYDEMHDKFLPLLPWPGEATRGIDISEIELDQIKLPEDAKKVLLSFMKENKVNSFELTAE